MKKRFNVTGNCIPEQHYMADVSAKFARILDMVEMGEYFTINRPRQYGKTTMLFRLAEPSQHGAYYQVLDLSFEGLTAEDFRSEEDFCAVFLKLLENSARYQRYDALVKWLKASRSAPMKFSGLSDAITEMANQTDKKIVLLIDEVDKSSNNQLFLDFLGLLRNKYLTRQRTKTFHSVVLAGVYDVKNLKLKLHPDTEKKYNSPWNIAADFEVNMDLQPNEIAPMLEEYARDRGVALDAQALAQHIVYYTSGHPFLVSKVCKIVDEKLLPEKTEATWTVHDVDMAARQLIKESNVNFDDLIKNLANNPDLYDLTLDVVVHQRDLPFDPNEPSIQLGVIYGIFARGERLAIHNRIYREVIASYMTVSLLVKGRDEQGAFGESSETYLMPGNRMDIKGALRRFQTLMKAEYNKKDRAFLERQGRLVFLAFLSPILNGHGHAFKEPQSSEERRLDVVISYHQHRYVIELKVWRGPAAHERGLSQLAAYLNTLGLEEGYLLIFDQGATKQWTEQEIVHEGKKIFAVWV